MFRYYRKHCNENGVQKDIAEKWNVTEQLVSTYKKKFDWDQRVKDWNNSNRASLEKLLKMRDDAIEDGDPDAVWKIQKTIQAIDGEFDRLAYTIEIMDDFLEYLKKAHPEEFNSFQNILPDFLSAQRNKYKSN